MIDSSFMTGPYSTAGRPSTITDDGKKLVRIWDLSDRKGRKIPQKWHVYKM